MLYILSERRAFSLIIFIILIVLFSHLLNLVTKRQIAKEFARSHFDLLIFLKDKSPRQHFIKSPWLSSLIVRLVGIFIGHNYSAWHPDHIACTLCLRVLTPLQAA